MRKKPEDIIRYADMFTAMGTEPRLRIMQLLLSAHPEGLVVGEIITDLGLSASTLSHHLEKLKNENLVHVRRESTFLPHWYDRLQFDGGRATKSFVITTLLGLGLQPSAR